MKNINYNLVKMLHSKLDDLWRIEKFYLRDAKKTKSKNCEKLFAEMQKDLKKEIKLLQQEIARHLGHKKFD
ncbi:MAG: hypothetical protein A2Y82_04305 [Candidatus Buchananbacteria bacterium RBG_13_36_9]|jgi:hypothetical protein|uniref:Uncharacterized protein n=1 Tax=Candidatus Buchananbacteria bacterium RBG_13_36_9 TaxID=1797530 RepID=A0A1G1XQK6_9BACT|nr:MAG: hypothetical protein A2Y82_04305 [Candidatus Buchananbacteria bacterium RBG_13_36_9]